MAEFPGRRFGGNGAFGASLDQQQDTGSTPNALAAVQSTESSRPFANPSLSRPWLSRYGLGAKYIETPAESGESAFDWAQNAFRKFQNGPAVPRPNLAESFMPVVGPAWEAVADLHDGNYGGAAFNGAMAVVDALPVGVAFKGLRAAEKGAELLKKGSKTAGAAQRAYRRMGMVKAGEETHHTIPLNGIKRNVQNWRNHDPFLKALPQETHQRLTRRWNGKPRFDPIQRVWYGTTDWMKAVPAGLAGYTADAWENLTHPFDGGQPTLSSERPVIAKRVIRTDAQPNPNLR